MTEMEGDREKMRPIKERRRSPSSPARERPSRPRSPTLLPPSASLLDAPLISQDEDDANHFEGLKISPNSNPRSFPHSVKQQCWEKAEKIKGRDPDRWRRDALGNTVFRKLVGCPGCLCHDYDHIIPYSKGGQSTLENCQVLQTPIKERIPALVSAKVNRSKGNRTEISKSDLIQKSSYCRVSGRDMDLLELSAYGNVRRGQDSGGCAIQ